MTASEPEPEFTNPEPPNQDSDSEDSYYDGPYLVFTEAYHLKRGYCCQSGCRHCPYGFEIPRASQPTSNK